MHNGNNHSELHFQYFLLPDSLRDGINFLFIALVLLAFLSDADTISFAVAPIPWSKIKVESAAMSILFRARLIRSH